MIWVFNEGYDEKVVHLIREWTYTGELATPWGALFGQTRPKDACFVTSGVRWEF